MSKESFDAVMDFAVATLSGDMRNRLITDLLKGPGKWSKMQEHEQEAAIRIVQDISEEIVRRAVHLIATRSRHPIVARLKSVVCKSEITCTITLPKKDDMRHALMDATGHEVLVIISDANDFIGEGERVEADLDQPDLPFHGGEDGDEEAA